MRTLPELAMHAFALNRTTFRRTISLLLGTYLLLGCTALAADTPRLLVLTDIGGDPDDQQSLVRLLLYANEFEIEGLVASASGTPGELKEAVTKPQLIRETVEAYGKVQPGLMQHSTGYPRVEQLRALIKSGNPQRGLNAIGEDRDTEGSRWIIAAVDKPDARPLNLSIWGGQTDFAQALWRVRKDRSPADLAKFLAKLRVYDINDQDRIADWILGNFPQLFYVLAQAPTGRDKREGAYRGVYLGGDESLTSRAWIDQHVRTGHGLLGALYPTKTWTAPNPHGVMKEGDTPSWFFFLRNGVNSPENPSWGGWGGRFMTATNHVFRDARDTVGTVTDARATVWRWRAAFQADFQARLDWCVKPANEGNHPPKLIVNGDSARSPMILRVKAGDAVKLNALDSTDPDGHALTARWWLYREAGSYEGKVEIENAATASATVRVPADAKGRVLHVILEMTDHGTPSLTSLRRVVLNVVE